jgi:hypothetical protein
MNRACELHQAIKIKRYLMNLFKQKKTTRRPDAEWLVTCRAWIDKRQRLVANYLARKTQHRNRSSKIIALALFILLFGGSCLLLLIHAIIQFNH